MGLSAIKFKYSAQALQCHDIIESTRNIHSDGGDIMEQVVRILIDPKSPGSDQLMKSLLEELKGLEVGEIKEQKEAPPPGTLAEPMTVLLILKIAYWSVKIGWAIFKIVQEVRERQAASQKQKLELVPRVIIAVGESTPSIIELPSHQKKEEQFLISVTNGGKTK